MYLTSKMAERYYNQENDYILARSSPLEKFLPPGIKFHKLPSGFYAQFVLEWVFYTLGNGLTFNTATEPGESKRKKRQEDERKDKLGDDFDMRLLMEGIIPACHAGVSYGFWDNDHVMFFSAKEGFPLLDERTSNIMVFIRFWRLDDDKPMYVELYEKEGITEYSTVEQDNQEQLQIDSERRAYKTTIMDYPELGESEVVDTETYSELPIFPLYVNDRKKTEFTKGLKSQIDAYDAISSDNIDSILQNEGIHWIFANYGGEDLNNLINLLQLKLYKSDADAAGTDVANFTVESPYQGKQTALERLERRMHEDFMQPYGMNDGRAVTATEIKNATQNKNIKADILEWRACQFVGNLLRLQGIEYKQSELSFKRRSLIDDSEVINNVSTMLSDDYIDAEKALELNPYIADEEVDAILDRLDVEQMEEADKTFPLNSGDEQEGEEDEQQKDLTGMGKAGRIQNS